MNTTMIEAVIFDLDGTLLNTLDDIAGSVNATLRHFQLPEVTRDKVRRSVGNGGRNLIRCVVPGGESHPQFEEIFSYYVPYYEQHCQILTRAYEGILPTLKTLKEMGKKLAIVSNKGDGAVKELSKQYFSDLVETSVGERAGIRRKPNPDSVLEAMRLMGMEKENVLYVGDSEVDHATAQAAGVKVVLVSWGFREKADLEKLGPDYLIDKPEELVALATGFSRLQG